jgi:hypothetical protein
VEVVRNHFVDHKDSERQVFRHPRRLQHHEMDRLREGLPKSLEHATSHVRDDGAEAIDSLGLGLMHSHTSSEASAQHEQHEQPEKSQAQPSLRQRIFGNKQHDEESGPELERNTSIRFAPDSSESSESAPGNYGNAAPGFKRNPSLAIFRSASVQSEGQNVTFQEPDKPR